MRTGELPRDSGPVRVASRRNRPPKRRSILGSPFTRASTTSVGQEESQIHRSRATAIAGRDVAAALPPGEEVAGPLQRCLVRSACRQIGEPFDSLLVMDARKRMGAAGLGRLDRDDQTAVGKRRIVPALAHAVGAEVAGIAHAGHHVAAGAHAEREEIAGAGLHRGGVFGGAQGGMAGTGAVAHPVDRRLGLFDPDAELKRLLLHGHAPAQQHAVGIASAVADRQDGEIGGDVARRRAQALEPAVRDVQVLDPAGEADFAAQRLKLAPEGADHERKPVRAQMRPVLVDDRRPAVALGEDFEDVGHVGAGAAGRELAVAERPGAAFAEEVIAFGIERAVLIESADVGDAILDGAAALEDQRLIPGARQQIAGEEAGGAGADDHRAVAERREPGSGHWK